MKHAFKAMIVALAVAMAAMVPTSSASASIPRSPTPSATADPVVSIMSAFGTAPVHTFSYSWGGATISVPAGCLFNHAIHGSGNYVQRHIVGTDCIGPGYWWGGFCNYQFRIRYYSTSNQNYSTYTSPLTSRCDYNTSYTFNQNLNFRTGYACAILVINGAERARQCHNILAS